MIRIVLVASCIAFSSLCSQQKDMPDVQDLNTLIFNGQVRPDILAVMEQYESNNRVPTSKLSKRAQLLQEYDEPDHGFLFYLALYLYTLDEK